MFYVFQVKNINHAKVATGVVWYYFFYFCEVSISFISATN